MCRGTMPSCSKSRRQTLRRSGQLLQHANRLGCIVSCIGRQIAHAFRADGCCRQCAKVDAGCGYRARDFRGGPRFVSPLDSHCVEVIGLGEAGVSGRPGDLSPFDGAEDEEPLAGLLRGPAREHKLKVSSCLSQRLEFFGSTSGPVFNRHSPHVGPTDLELHDLPTLHWLNRHGYPSPAWVRRSCASFGKKPLAERTRLRAEGSCGAGDSEVRHFWRAKNCYCINYVRVLIGKSLNLSNRCLRIKWGGEG